MSILIEDNDSPIITAEKIIHGTRPYDPSPLSKAIGIALTGKPEVLRKALAGKDGACTEEDMFDIDEIKEIADYLNVFYEANKDKD